MANTLIQNKTALHAAARQAVVVVLREIFSDPDVGFSLQSSATRRLKQSVRLKERGSVKDLCEVLRQYEK